MRLPRGAESSLTRQRSMKEAGLPYQSDPPLVKALFAAHDVSELREAALKRAIAANTTGTRLASKPVRDTRPMAAVAKPGKAPGPKARTRSTCPSATAISTGLPMHRSGLTNESSNLSAVSPATRDFNLPCNLPLWAMRGSKDGKQWLMRKGSDLGNGATSPSRWGLSSPQRAACNTRNT